MTLLYLQVTLGQHASAFLRGTALQPVGLLGRGINYTCIHEQESRGRFSIRVCFIDRWMFSADTYIVLELRLQNLDWYPK